LDFSTRVLVVEHILLARIVLVAVEQAPLVVNHLLQLLAEPVVLVLMSLLTLVVRHCLRQAAVAVLVL
jgi:hypothetical protein